jgi:hypothetical protein
MSVGWLVGRLVGWWVKERRKKVMISKNQDLIFHFLLGSTHFRSTCKSLESSNNFHSWNLKNPEFKSKMKSKFFNGN